MVDKGSSRANGVKDVLRFASPGLFAARTRWWSSERRPAGSRHLSAQPHTGASPEPAARSCGGSVAASDSALSPQCMRRAHTHTHTYDKMRKHRWEKCYSHGPLGCCWRRLLVLMQFVFVMTFVTASFGVGGHTGAENTFGNETQTRHFKFRRINWLDRNFSLTSAKTPRIEAMRFNRTPRRRLCSLWNRALNKWLRVLTDEEQS